MPKRTFSALALASALFATACSTPSSSQTDVPADDNAPSSPVLSSAPLPSPSPSPSASPFTYTCSTFISGSSEMERFDIDFAKPGLSQRRLATTAYGRNVTFGWARVIVREGAPPRILLSLTVANDALEAAASSNATGDPELLDISAGSSNPADLLEDKPLALVSCERSVRAVK